MCILNSSLGRSYLNTSLKLNRTDVTSLFLCNVSVSIVSHQGRFFSISEMIKPKLDLVTRHNMSFPVQFCKIH